MAKQKGKNAAKKGREKLRVFAGPVPEEDVIRAFALAEKDPAEVQAGICWGDLAQGLNSPATVAVQVEALQALKEQGSVLAAFFTGMLHRDGIGVEKDAAEAERLLSSAADGGLATACLEMAALLQSDGSSGDGNADGAEGGEAADGADEDDPLAKAMPWLIRGMEMGSPGCADELARLVCEGLAGIGDEERAVLCDRLDTFARAGSWPAAQLLLSLLQLFRPLPDQERRVKKAVEIVKEMARENWVPAIASLGSLTLEGGLVEQDTDRACQLLKKAWNRGDADAGCDLARLYEMYPEMEETAGAGRAILRSLAGKDVARACAELGCALIADDGEAGEAAPAAEKAGSAASADAVREGLALLRRAADQGWINGAAQAALSVAVRQRHPDCLAMALDLLTFLAEGGLEEAALDLALLRLNGLDGRPADTAEGLACARAGWDDHNPRACALLSLARLGLLTDSLRERAPISDEEARETLLWLLGQGDPMAELAWAMPGTESAVSGAANFFAILPAAQLPERMARALSLALERLDAGLILFMAAFFERADERFDACARDFAEEAGLPGIACRADAAAFLRGAAGGLAEACRRHL
ncbi:MAG: hypothetical protein Q4F72_02585 [Desulfovibrionaceae bacterium]|nr:hypothetical protein [Desulfovibrionaceae bacterium]